MSLVRRCLDIQLHLMRREQPVAAVRLLSGQKSLNRAQHPSQRNAQIPVGTQPIASPDADDRNTLDTLTGYATGVEAQTRLCPA